MPFFIRQIFVISLFVHLGMANALADPDLSEKANMARGVLLYEEGKYQEAYDLYFELALRLAPS